MINGGDQIIDFHLDLANGTEHDTLMLLGFSAAAHLDFVSASGQAQSYQLVDGSYTSARFMVVVVGSTAHLSGLDTAFA